MAIDFTRYNPPGIYTEAVGGPQLQVYSSVPTAVAIFGLTIGYRKARESIVINPDEDEITPAINRTLAHAGIRIDSLKVFSPVTGLVYEENTDWILHRITQGDDTTPATRDDLYTIRRVIDGGHIEPGETVTIEYRYTDNDYFKVYTFYDWDDLVEAYGEPFDAAGNIQSELTLMARFAFVNGAATVLACAVDPADPDNPTIGDYSNALDKFRDEERIAIITPASGAQPLHALVQMHVRAQSNNRYERRAIVARDGSVTPVSHDVRVINAQEIYDQRIAHVSPDSFDYFAPELNRVIKLGGQYMAAALAGITVYNIAAEPLTRKRVFGFIGPTTPQRDGEKNYESSQGLMVVERNKRQIIWVRHGVTTDVSDLHTREWSIIGQQDVMVYRIRDYLDNDGLIGSPIYDSTLILVKASAESALRSLVRDRIIRRFGALKVRQLATLPDVIEVRYEWLPAYPLNYLVVRFSIEVLTGDIEVTTA